MPDVSSKPKLSEMKYRVVSPLGNGAGSTILLISDKTAGGKRYALKVVKRQDADDDIYIAQAKVEYEAAQKLNHPAIAKIYDIRTKRAWFRISGVELLMEYVDGKTLDELEAPGHGSTHSGLQSGSLGVAHMHRRGVYHGDLKPSNIMLSKAGQVKLIDFGTAWIKGEEKNRIQGTLSSSRRNRWRRRWWMNGPISTTCGATMYRMFTGRFVQQGIPKMGESGSRKIPSPIQINPKIPGTLNETIMSCVEISPERRPAGMFEIKNQLAAVAKYLGLQEVDLKGADDEEF